MRKDARINNRGVTLTLEDLDGINTKLEGLCKRIEMLVPMIDKKGSVDLDNLFIAHMGFAGELAEMRDIINKDKLFATKGKFRRIPEMNNGVVLKQFVSGYMNR